MRRARRVKILATLGPASSTAETIRKLHEAGADAFRINMSHSSHEMMRALVGEIRALEASHGRPIAALVDLQGPKLRIGRFAAPPVTLTPGALFQLDGNDAPGDDGRVFLPHPEILAALEPGHRLLLNDGRVVLRVEEKEHDRVHTQVLIGGELSDKKGVSVPDTTIPIAALTEKDRRDLEAALAADADWIALSFVQRPEDVAEVRKIARGRARVMSKIEKPQAIDRLDEIIELSDGIMVARGDLGVEMPLEEVPGLQKRMTRACRHAGKPVVVATQMLESMISAASPTRAEVSDVATAVFEGADAVMLSAESASGDYPVEAVATMDRIAIAVERDPNYRSILQAQHTAPEPTGADAIAEAANQIAETLRVSAIICYTASGATALRVARGRPKAPMIAMTPVVKTGRHLALCWGVHCAVGQDADDVEDMVQRATSVAVEEGFCQTGDRIVIIAGVPFHTPGATNLLRLAFVGQTVRGD